MSTSLYAAINKKGKTKSMGEFPEYFNNHHRITSFPWSIYHAPLEKSLITTIENVLDLNHINRILVVGPGEFHEIGYLKQLNFEISILDIDPRVLDGLAKKHGNHITHFFFSDESLSQCPSNCRWLPPGSSLGLADKRYISPVKRPTNWWQTGI